VSLPGLEFASLSGVVCITAAQQEANLPSIGRKGCTKLGIRQIGLLVEHEREHCISVNYFGKNNLIPIIAAMIGIQSIAQFVTQFSASDCYLGLYAKLRIDHRSITQINYGSSVPVTNRTNLQHK
jgi:hypothetical protein